MENKSHNSIIVVSWIKIDLWLMFIKHNSYKRQLPITIKCHFILNIKSESIGEKEKEILGCNLRVKSNLHPIVNFTWNSILFSNSWLAIPLHLLIPNAWCSCSWLLQILWGFCEWIHNNAMQFHSLTLRVKILQGTHCRYNVHCFKNANPPLASKALSLMKKAGPRVPR